MQVIFLALPPVLPWSPWSLTRAEGSVSLRTGAIALLPASVLALVRAMKFDASCAKVRRGYAVSWEGSGHRLCSAGRNTKLVSVHQRTLLRRANPTMTKISSICSLAEDTQWWQLAINSSVVQLMQRDEEESRCTAQQLQGVAICVQSPDAPQSCALCRDPRCSVVCRMID